MTPNLSSIPSTPHGLPNPATLGPAAFFLVVLGGATTPVMIALGVVAVVFGTLNVVGGFVVTDRMLEMFKKRPRIGGKQQ